METNLLEFRMSTAQLGGDDRYVLSLAGELDLYTAPRVRQQLNEVVRGGGRFVVVDLQDATFVDSTMLGILLDALQELRTVQGELVVVSDDPRILRPFQVTGLDRVFRLERTLGAAVGGNGSHPAPPPAA
jgi:anti-sigma B factor antagonist